MLKMISWSEFLSSLIILTIIYYIFIVVKFYKWEILSLVQGKGDKKDPGSKDEKQEMFKATEKAITFLTSTIGELKGQPLSKDEFISKIKTALSQYSYLKGTPYAVAVNHFIIREANSTIPLAEQEVKDLWE